MPFHARRPLAPVRTADDDALDDFLDELRSRSLSAETVRSYQSVLFTLQSYTGTLVGASTRELRRFQGRDGVSPGTRRLTRAVLSRFYGFLFLEGYRHDDPSVRLAAVKVPRGKPRPLTAEQVDAILTSGAYRRTRAMILLGYYQGFRVGSIARVHGADIDLETKRIRTVVKGGKVRTMPLHPTIAELALTMPRDDWWFPARRDHTGHVRPGPVRSGSVTDLITKAIRRAGITDPNLTPHSLRHAFGTDLVEAGEDIRVVQELMMHESLEYTQVYTGVSERRKQEGIVRLQPRALPTQSGRRAA